AHRGIGCHHPQRPSGRLQFERQAPLAHVVVGQPCREPVVAWRPPLAERIERHIRRIDRGLGGLVWIRTPEDIDLARLPRAAREDACCAGHGHTVPGLLATEAGSTGPCRAPHLPWRYLNYRCKNIQARASPSPPRRRTHRLASVSRRLKHWGWGYEDEQPSHEEQRAAAVGIVEHLGFGSPDPEQPVPLSDVQLPAPRLQPPTSLANVCSTDPYERALHACGRSYSDIVRAFRGRFDHPPDVVARPRDEAEVHAVLDWALSAGAAVIPFGGGTSVVGGVEPKTCDGYAAIVTIDLKALDRVLEVDPVSLSARIQAGA